MMAKFRTYKYNIKNPEKYMGADVTQIVLRSSWELDFAKHCDLLPNIVQWGYELISIPYRDPLTGRQKIYIPDFFVRVSTGKGGATKDFLFEIKPRHEQLDDFARNSADAALIARNRSKWTAAAAWADRHQAEFQILNEADLYTGESIKIGRKYPVKGYAHTKAKKQNIKTKPATKKASKRPVYESIKPRSTKSAVRRVSSVPSTSRTRQA